MNKTQRPVIFIMAGGTGGHILPGLAVAKKMQDLGWQVLWLGNQTGMEQTLVTATGITLIDLRFSALRGKGFKSLLSLPWRLLTACLRARTAFKKYRPSVTLGMGGYVAFPGGIMSRLLGVPLILHEQNSIPGLTNKVLAKCASKVLTGFPNILNGEYVGNPVRDRIVESVAPEIRYASRQGALRILVVGGSLGAQALNKIVPKALALLPLEQRPVVTHQAGQKMIDSLIAAYQEADVIATCVSFIDDMATAYAEADLVICRAGAMTVAEVSVMGVAALFVPYPHAVDDHQTYNAHFLSAQGAAQQVSQDDLTPDYLARFLAGVKREDLMSLAQQARKMAKADATQIIVERCVDVVQEGKNYAA